MTTPQNATTKHFIRTLQQNEHKQLLCNLKTTIETVFLNNKYSDDELLLSTERLFRLYTCIERIFTNGIRVFKVDNSADLWQFIEGLDWINPLMTTATSSTPSSPSSSAAAAAAAAAAATTSKVLSPNIHIPYNRIRSDRALRWIYEHLARKKLSQKLHYLVSDREHLSNCYEPFAFLRMPHYVEAFLICLKSIENDQLNLLTQIDPNLYKNQIDQIQHKRSTSHPDFSYVTNRSGCEPNDAAITMGNRNSVQFYYNNSDSESCQSIQLDLTSDHSGSMKYVQMQTQRSFHPKAKQRKKRKQKQFVSLKLRPWHSLPDFHHQQQTAVLTQRSRSNTISQSIDIPVQKIRLTAEVLAMQNRRKDFDSYHHPVPSASGSSSADPTPGTSSQLLNHLMPISLVKCDDIKIHFDRKFATNLKPKEISEKLLSESIAATETLKQSSPMRIFSFLPKSPLISPPSDKSESIYSTLLLSAGSAPGDFVNTFLTKDGEKIKKFYENPFVEYENDQFSSGSMIPNHQSHDDHHQRPLIGQSLASFLQTGQFSRANSELERENAHFSVSEAMISAIEQIKWRNLEKNRTKKCAEIERQRTGTTAKKRKQRRRRRRRRCSIKSWQFCDNVNHQKESVESNPMSSNESVCSNYSDTETSTDDDDDEDNVDSDDDDPSFLQELSVSSQNLSDHTAYAEWGDNNLDTLSAESVALCLITKFSEKQLPRASDLLWLVSEQDVPQKMLPLPGSWAINPDEIYKIPFTRGTRDWAPPRPQIIFTRHSPIERKKQLQNQNHRCAGCGMKVAIAYSHRFRYCEYVGKYFCTGCHRNHISVIPAHVLEKWNFTSYPVSVFSYRLLEQIWSFPLFRVSDLNRNLYSKVAALTLAKHKRQQLKFVHDFIFACRFAESSKSSFDNISAHILTDFDIWSMADFTAVKNGSMVKDISQLIAKCETHILQCELCTAHGFICELCPKKQVIFPWQTKIKRCDNCGVCVHQRCWKNNCPKCERLLKRQQQQPQQQQQQHQHQQKI